MRHSIFALSLAAALALWPAQHSYALSAAAQGDWSAVQSLTPGVKVVVRTKDGERVRGVFEHATDLVLVVARGGRQLAFDRERVRRVQIDRGKSRLNGALLGGAVGGAAGFGVGGAIYFPYRDDIVGVLVPAATGLGAGIGAAVGAALGKGNKNVTVYEAP